jgi:hypothetical protein
MARISMQMQSWGVLQDDAGNVLPNQSVQIKNRDGTAATHYSAITGGTSSTATMTTDSMGRLNRFIEAGEYIFTHGGTDYYIEAASGAGGGGGGGGGALPSGGSVGQVVTNTGSGTGTWQDPAVTTSEYDSLVVRTDALEAADVTTNSVFNAHQGDTTSVHGVTDTAGLGYVLRWDSGSSNYLPSSVRGSTERHKTFVGPTDPNGLSGVVLAVYDRWVDVP